MQSLSPKSLFQVRTSKMAIINIKKLNLKKIREIMKLKTGILITIYTFKDKRRRVMTKMMKYNNNLSMMREPPGSIHLLVARIRTMMRIPLRLKTVSGCELGIKGAEE